MKAGDRIYITFQGRTAVGMVLLASENQKSLAVTFEDMLGGYLMMMPVLMDEHGVYRDLIDHDEVVITREEDHLKERPI